MAHYTHGNINREYLVPLGGCRKEHAYERHTVQLYDEGKQILGIAKWMLENGASEVNVIGEFKPFVENRSPLSVWSKTE